jgi:hypothetical protein
VKELKMAVEVAVEAGTIMPPAPESEKRTADSENITWATLLEKENLAKLRWDGNKRVVCR